MQGRERGFTVAAAVIGKIAFKDLPSARQFAYLGYELDKRRIAYDSKTNFTSQKTLRQESEIQVGNAPPMHVWKEKKELYTGKGLPKYFRPLSDADFSILDA